MPPNRNNLTSWPHKIYQTLRDREWHVAGDLFTMVEREIPLHYATRYNITQQKAAVKKRRKPSDDPNTDNLDLPDIFTARWNFFRNRLSTIGIEPERTTINWTTNIRLKYVKDRTCSVCNGPVIKAGWSGSQKSVTCLACEKQPDKPIDEPIDPPTAPEAPPTATIAEQIPEQVTQAPQAPEVSAQVAKVSPTSKPKYRQVYYHYGKLYKRREMGRYLQILVPGLSINAILNQLDRCHGEVSKFLTLHQIHDVAAGELGSLTRYANGTLVYEPPTVTVNGELVQSRSRLRELGRKIGKLIKPWSKPES